MKIGVKMFYIIFGSLWENGYCEFFNGLMCDELFNGEIFYMLVEVCILIEVWWWYYNIVRLYSLLGY